MGKKGLSDKVRKKLKNKTKPPPNPFEVKVNKIKHNVVNRKVQKWEKGIPGVSRSKAVKKRKETLLSELHHMKKSNSLLDKRFGENDTNLTSDEKMVQRFALEKKSRQGKADIFSLNEEEDVLTHYGQSLAENLKDTVGDSDEEDDSEQIRTGQFQFGGFSKEEPVSWKEKMKEVIADSKKQKYEKQAEKEKTLDATKNLDTDWKNVVATYAPFKENQKLKKNEYSQLFHNIVMEQKSAVATDKLKTDEEKAIEDADKLKKLEAERLARMKGDHISADDMDDGFDLNADGDSKEESDEEEIGSDDETSEDSADDSEESDNENDDFSDLKSDDGSDEENEETKTCTKEEGNREKKTDSQGDAAKKELPFVFEAPGSYEELMSLLHGHSSVEQAIIISRLRKCHHPSLAEGNKSKLETIHLYLLQYFGDVVSQHHVEKKLVTTITNGLWEMTQMFPTSTASSLQSLVLARQKEYSELAEKKGGRGSFPSIDTLLYLQLVEFLFPASDFRHPVTTPSLLFISQMLSESSVRSCVDVVAGLYLSALALKYVNLSKRYIPEVVTFLHGLLVLASNKQEQEMPTFPPFKSVGKGCDLLHVKEKCEHVSEEWSLSQLLSDDSTLNTRYNSNQFKCDAVNICLDLLLACQKIWEELPCLDYVLMPLRNILASLPSQLYPDTMKTKIKDLSVGTDSKRIAMVHEAKKPVPLKLFEPKIEEFWTGKKKKGGSNKEANEKQKLRHKYKRELKATVREIQRDSQVLAKHRLDTIMAKDAERKRKTKELLNSLAQQEGEYKKIKRMKEK